MVLVGVWLSCCSGWVMRFLFLGVIWVWWRLLFVLILVCGWLSWSCLIFGVLLVLLSRLLLFVCV